MRLNTTVNRILIAADSVLNSFWKRKINNKNVVVVFQQIFGDSVVIQNSLEQYVSLFPKEKGWKVYFLVRPSVLSFMRDTMPLPENINYVEVDFKKFLENYKYYKDIVKKYKNFAGTIIVPGTSFSAEVFTAVSNAKNKIGLIRSIDVTKPWIMAYFYKKAYTEIVRPKKSDMMLQRHRKLINHLWTRRKRDYAYQAKLPKLLKKDRLIKESYAVMCLGSSKVEKCWPIERFAEIADYIYEVYKLSIHLCGGVDEKIFEEQLLEKVRNKEAIISHIGGTSFSDWSAIVQHADIVIGNDSATMHLAAAGRVPAVCIAGVYDKYQFFPYKVDKLEDGDRLPVTVLKDMPCEWCRTIGYDAGYGNKECKKRIDAGLCATCIDKITVNDVKAAVDGLMKEEKR